MPRYVHLDEAEAESCFLLRAGSMFAGCMTQLRKLEGALGDGGVDTLDAFHTDAMNLYNLADELADRCQDVMLWRIARGEMEAGSRDEG